MTAKESLLSALVRASGGHGVDASFTWPEVVDLVWKADKERFGMRGYHLEFPDTKRISVAISQISRRYYSRPACVRWISTGLLCLTSDGLEFGRQAIQRTTKGAA